jgi:hypothetical protein
VEAAASVAVVAVATAAVVAAAMVARCATDVPTTPEAEARVQADPAVVVVATNPVPTRVVRSAGGTLGHSVANATTSHANAASTTINRAINRSRK